MSFEKIKEVIEKIKNIPGLKIGWVICNPNIMTIDSEIHEYETAEKLLKTHTATVGWAPDRLMPVFWISDEEDDEYSPSESLKD